MLILSSMFHGTVTFMGHVRDSLLPPLVSIYHFFPREMKVMTSYMYYVYVLISGTGYKFYGKVTKWVQSFLMSTEKYYCVMVLIN